MRELFQPVPVVLAALACATLASAQAPKTAQPKAAATKAASPDQVVATINGEKITKTELREFLGGHVPLAGDEEQDYKDALNILINDRLLNQYFDEQKVEVSRQEVDAEIAQFEKSLKEQHKQDLKTALAETDTTVDELRARITPRLRWQKFVNTRATDDELKKYVAKHKDEVDGTLVRASHILLAVDPKASPAEKAKVKQKLLGIKKEIEAGKLSFGDAANKFSEDEGSVATKNGGDLGLFPRQGRYLEPFSAAAFALKKGSISDPVKTEYGYHLIQVTDRKDGPPINFEKSKDDIKHAFARDLLASLLEERRKASKIVIQPMPPDLFPKVPALMPAPTNRPAAPKAAAPR